MPPTPITADYKLQMVYSVDSLQHKQQNYCDVVASADPSGWDLVHAFGGTNVGLQTAVDLFFTRIAPFYNTAWSSFDGWVLLGRTGTEFEYVDSGVTTVAPSGSNAMEKANGVCISGKDYHRENMPFYLYEGAFGSANKYTAVGALGASARALVNYVFNPDGTAAAAAAYYWRISRGKFPTKRWLAWITDTNEKLRRVRGIK